MTQELYTAEMAVQLWWTGSLAVCRSSGRTPEQACVEADGYTAEFPLVLRCFVRGCVEEHSWL